MKDIYAILKGAGLEVPADKKETFDKEVAENYKTVADYDKQKGKLDTAESKVKADEDTMKELKIKLDAVKDVNVDDLKKQISDLTDANKKKDEDYNSKIAERDLSDLISGCISAAGGKNAKAIKALLDMDKIKESKNQKADVESMIKGLTEAEDSKMLFGASEEDETEHVDPIGKVGKGSTGMSGVEAEFYRKNPDLKPEE